MKYLYLTCFALILLFIAGCNDTHGLNKTHYPYMLSDIAWVDSKLCLSFPPDTTDREKELLIESAKVQLDFYEMDNGSSKPCDIIYFNKDFLSKQGDNTEYWGLFFSPRGPIHIIMGKYYESSVLYHELCHLNHAPTDVNHIDPRWNNLWYPRQEQVFSILVADRRNIILK